MSPSDPRLLAYASLGAVERELIADDMLDYANGLGPEDRRGATLVIHRFMRLCRAHHKRDGREATPSTSTAPRKG